MRQEIVTPACVLFVLYKRKTHQKRISGRTNFLPFNLILERTVLFQTIINGKNILYSLFALCFFTIVTFLSELY